MGDERRIKTIRLFAMLLLALPAFLSMLGVGGVLSSFIETALGVDGDEAEVAFRANVCAELLGALFSVVALLLLLKCAAGRAVRKALWLLVLPELYMLYYWYCTFMSPGRHTMGIELWGNVLLLLAVILCCYAWSLLWRNERLGEKERTWVLFLFMPYSLSFVAFFAPMWQQYVPEGSSMYLLPENNPVYILFAFVMNVMRVVAVWFFVKSRLFATGQKGEETVENDSSALNRCVLGIMLSAFFIINGLALVYKNAHLFVDL